MFPSTLPFILVQEPNDLDSSCRKFVDPFTKEEYSKHMKLQQGKTQNRVLVALGWSVPNRAHPDLKKKKKKKKKISKKDNSSNEDDEEGSSDGSADDSEQSASSDHELKRKHASSKSPIAASSKHVRIAVDSDYELDDDAICFDLLAVGENAEVALVDLEDTTTADFTLRDLNTTAAPLEVLASDAEEIQKEVHVDVETDSMEKTSVGRVEAAFAGEKSSRPTSSSAGDQAQTESVVAAPSPELVKEVLGDCKPCSIATRCCQKALLEICARRKKSLDQIAKLENDRSVLSRELDKMKTRKRLPQKL
uniref:Uncharacterized protein n=1 Tax=Oryza punctata TaxID=4537 RepID=A0A0E0K392_ORYPU